VGVSAPGKKNDFVRRFFAPKLGVNEDPVTVPFAANWLPTRRRGSVGYLRGIRNLQIC
jgi:predicted PhzF superfamily epimerase YddE/YHI9